MNGHTPMSGLIFGLSLYLHPYFVYVSSEGSCVSAHMHRLTEPPLLHDAHAVISTVYQKPLALVRIQKYNEINDLFIVACANQNGSFHVTYTCLCSLSTSNLSLYFLHILKNSNDVIDTCRFTDTPFIITCNAPVCRCSFTAENGTYSQLQIVFTSSKSTHPFYN